MKCLRRFNPHLPAALALVALACSCRGVTASRENYLYHAFYGVVSSAAGPVPAATVTVQYRLPDCADAPAQQLAFRSGEAGQYRAQFGTPLPPDGCFTVVTTPPQGRALRPDTSVGGRLHVGASPSDSTRLDVFLQPL